MSKKIKNVVKYPVMLTPNAIQEIQEVLDGAANFSMSLPGSTSKATDRASELALTFQNAVDDVE